MGRNRKLRKRIRGLEEQITEHERKIRSELHSDLPDQDRIDHWEAEIRAFKESRERALRRLGRER